MDGVRVSIFNFVHLRRYLLREKARYRTFSTQALFVSLFWEAFWTNSRMINAENKKHVSLAGVSWQSMHAEVLESVPLLGHSNYLNFWASTIYRLQKCFIFLKFHSANSQILPKNSCKVYFLNRSSAEHSLLPMKRKDFLHIPPTYDSFSVKYARQGILKAEVDPFGFMLTYDFLRKWLENGRRWNKQEGINTAYRNSDRKSCSCLRCSDSLRLSTWSMKEHLFSKYQAQRSRPC